MPEFRLEEFKHPLGRPPVRVIFTKNEYQEKVKMPDWDQIKESEPKDNNPYDPPGGNQFLSTYNRIGHMDEVEHFVTTTSQMLEQVKLKETVKYKVDRRPMVTYETYKEKCKPKIPSKCPPCAPSYTSTMHDSYKIPFPCVMKPLSVPKIPFLKNRRLLWEAEELSTHKFFDDDYMCKIKRLQEIKGARSVSYSPFTQMYSDGTPVKTRKVKCHDLPYMHKYN